MLYFFMAAQSIDEELSSTSGVFPDIFVLNSNSVKLSELYSLHVQRYHFKHSFTTLIPWFY